MHRAVKWLPAALLTFHIAAKIYAPGQSLLIDLLAYNVIWLAAVIAITQAPLMNDPRHCDYPSPTNERSHRTRLHMFGNLFLGNRLFAQ
jgi:hypothetical protein